MTRSIEDFERVGMTFEAQFRGSCAIDHDHNVKRGDKVCRVQRADNPTIVVTGVACKNCTKVLPRARG